MTLLLQGPGLGQRVEVGPIYKYAQKTFCEDKLNWKDLPGWPGRQYATASVGLRKGLRFERDKPNAS
jgi:hypothetical protein